MRRSSGETGQHATLVGALLLAGGFVVLAVTWASVSLATAVPGQLRDVLLGGVSGLAMVGAGCALLDIQAERRAEADEEAALDRLLRGG